MRDGFPALSNEQILEKVNFRKGVPRKEVSDLQFTVNGKVVEMSNLNSLHDQLFDKQTGSYCPGCSNAADVCQPVAKLSAGKHKIGFQVKPATYDHPDMHVDVLEVLLVG